MCANYTPVTRAERLLAWFGAGHPHPSSADDLPEETFPGLPVPFVRRLADDSTERDLQLGLFGLLPHWATDAKFARRTYNARSETAAVKPSFRDAWLRGRRCIVPCEDFFEPRWEAGRVVRWRIARRDAMPIGIAGLWNAWHGPDGARLLSFTMLTVNADSHELMREFHKPGEEKRMVAILDQDDFDAWLQAPVERMPGLLTTYPAERLHAEPAPLPPKAAAKREARSKASAADSTRSLFGEDD